MESLVAPVNLWGPARVGPSAAGIFILVFVGGRVPFCLLGFGHHNKQQFDANSLLFDLIFKYKSTK